jgi:hypothetical protein
MHTSHQPTIHLAIQLSYPLDLQNGDKDSDDKDLQRRPRVERFGGEKQIALNATQQRQRPLELKGGADGKT